MFVLKILGELCGDASVLLTMCLDSGKRTGNVIDFDFVSDTRGLVDARVVLTKYSPLDDEGWTVHSSARRYVSVELPVV